MQQGPSSTLRAYAKALREGRADDAYALLSGEAKRSISPEAFRKLVRENATEMQDIARTLSGPTSDPVVTATATGPQGETVLLVYEGGAWKIDAESIDLYSQATPTKALRAFLRAFDGKRWEILVRFVAESHLKGVTPEQMQKLLQTAWEGPQKDEMSRIVSAVRAALPTAKIEETGDRATMAYGAGGTVQMMREHGVWKIDDFD